jgi:hypothetical protein
MRPYRLGREKALHFVLYRRDNPAIAGESPLIRKLTELPIWRLFAPLAVPMAQ